MDSFELNKIIAAILMVALLVIGLGKIADSVFYVKKPKNPGYQVKVESQLASSTSQTAEVEEKIDIASIMALGDVVSGEKIFKKCAACHSINKGGKNKIGPALYNAGPMLFFPPFFIEGQAAHFLKVFSPPATSPNAIIAAISIFSTFSGASDIPEVNWFSTST